MTAPTITITPEALDNIRELREEYGGPGWGLRFGLTGGGCAGWRYVLEFEEAPTERDHVLEFGDVRVFIDPEHVDKLDRCTIDWEETLMSSGFKIDNPHAKSSCGCGESVEF